MNSNSNFIISNSQETEINKILQDGIDKSLLYIQSFNTNTTSSNLNANTYPFIKSNTSKISNFSDGLSKISKRAKNSAKNIRPLTGFEKKISTTKFNNSTLKKSKSNNKIRTMSKKGNILDYQYEYNKKKEELAKVKGVLIQERIKYNKLKKEMDSKSRKEEEFKKLEENNRIIKKNTEDLILKIQRGERIRMEQSNIIEGLLREYNAMINELRNMPGVEIVNKFKELEDEAEQLKIESNGKKKEKKKSKRKVGKKNFKRNNSFKK